MKITHVLGHNSNWNIESYIDNNIGDYFLITAFTHGIDYCKKKSLSNILKVSMLDLQFYGKSVSIKGGKLNEFPFHPTCNIGNDSTSVYFDNCVKRAIQFQLDNKHENIIIPLFYENEDVNDIINAINSINSYVSKLDRKNHKFFMTLPFANHIIIDSKKVESILMACTDMKICFDGYFVTSENKPETRKKLTTDIKILRNLSRVFKTLKQQEFQTIYAYANWDAILFLAQTDIDYITIGTYENLRQFDIKRFTEDESGGGSKGYYFSEKLLNMVKANDLEMLRDTGNLEIIRNDKNIFSDIILKEGYPWNIHKPDVNKNYLLAISNLLKKISSISDLELRKAYLGSLINEAIAKYNNLESKSIYLNNEGSNYHLNVWKAYLANS
ncbi:MAG: hypothetical protein WCX31_00095 [Salinivirgaceae bacterium]|jgi:hypothetical protein